MSSPVKAMLMMILRLLPTLPRYGEARRIIVVGVFFVGMETDTTSTRTRFERRTVTLLADMTEAVISVSVLLVENPASIRVLNGQPALAQDFAFRRNARRR